MEKVTWHSELHVILYTTFSSVRNAGNTSMTCVQGKTSTRFFSCLIFLNVTFSLSDHGWSSNYYVLNVCNSSVSSPFKKARDYALWLWSAHNKVNERLMKDEESPGTGDPEFPKVIWPPKQLCPSCYLNPGKTSDENSKIDWNKDEVFKFLVSYYGKELVNLYEDVKELQAGGSTQKTVNEELVASTDAVVVPLGAALAIAVASCAFGALACFWRSQQKNRKYKYLLFEEYITITYDNHSSWYNNNKNKLILKQNLKCRRKL